MEKQTIYGQPPSKSNCYRIVTVQGKSSLSKTPALKKYERDFYLQCGLRNAKIAGKFKLSLDVYFGSDRPDLDNSLKVILDCLQACKVITNDRNCTEIHARKLIDKKNPRIEFTIEKEFES